MTNLPSSQLLFEKFLADECSPEEFRQVIDMLVNQSEDSEMRRLLREQLLRPLPADHSDPELRSRLEDHLKQILVHNGIEQPKISRRADIFTLRRVVAAACIIVAVVTGLYWYSVRPRPGQQVTTAGISPAERPDVAAPVTAHAVITLEDGSTIILDSAHNGSLTPNLVKLNAGELSYDGTAGVKPEYHTLSLPRGSRPINLELADGSRVWINAASSLRYPTVFTGPERMVEITGEAYFEVAKNADRKFVVNANGVRTEVLGTHFNVNAYSDESDLKITLLEGSVRVYKEGGASGMLTPGQQAQFNSSGGLKVLNDAPLAEVMAWKDGLFRFDGTDIKSIMRELSRWYDVEVTYKGEIPPYPFVAKIPRTVPVSELLRLLELTNLVHFKIENKGITVEP